MQEVQIKLEAVTALNLRLTDAEKKCQGLEAQLQPLKEAQAVSYSFRHQKGTALYHILQWQLSALSACCFYPPLPKLRHGSVFILSCCCSWLLRRGILKHPEHHCRPSSSEYSRMV